MGHLLTCTIIMNIDHVVTETACAAYVRHNCIVCKLSVREVEAQSIKCGEAAARAVHANFCARIPNSK